MLSLQDHTVLQRQIECDMGRTGDTRVAPRIDGEQAQLAQKGATHGVARVTREWHPGSTVSKRS